MSAAIRPLSFWMLIGALVSMQGIGCSKRNEDVRTEDMRVQETPAEQPPAAAEVSQSGPSPSDPQPSTAADTVPPIFVLDAEELLAMRLPEDQARQGWIRLFDGHTLYGWQMAGTANWHTADQELIVDAGEPSLLCTSLDWLNYELRLEFKADPETNSGIFLRTPLVPEDPASDCYELNIAPPENPFPTGSLVGRRKWEPAELGDFDHSAWHTYVVRVEDAAVTVRLDDRELYRWEDPMPLPAGRIAVQHNQGRIAFRNILLRPLGFAPLLQTVATTAGTEAEDPQSAGPGDPEAAAEAEQAEPQPDTEQPESGEGAADALVRWKRYPEMEGKFEVHSQGILRVRGGLGQLETRETYGDFVLLAEAKTAGPEQNSGIFFRCIPGETLMGYECQINNDTVAGDPLRPADCGTGGFFRRQDARIVAADNGEWFTLVLAVKGPEMAAWVNGLQVSEWRDTRPPDPNPRRGLRLQPGTIMLQAHDPGTDVSFRDLRIASRDQPATTSQEEPTPDE